MAVVAADRANGQRFYANDSRPATVAANYR